MGNPILISSQENIIFRQYSFTDHEGTETFSPRLGSSLWKREILLHNQSWK